MVTKRINVFLYQDHVDFLNSRSQTISETVRTALDLLKKKETKYSKSPSQKKEGE